MIPTDRFEQVQVESLDQLREWLERNAGRDESVWMVRFKKSVPAKFVNRLDALDELLCFGWVDGLARVLDEERTMQLISPRRQQAWSQTYKDRADRLEAEGRMRPSGRAAIERSKALGLWDAYAEVDALTIPPDLRNALRADPAADRFFLKAAPSYRRNVLRWIASAKKPETRAARVMKALAFSARCQKIPQM